MPIGVQTKLNTSGLDLIISESQDRTASAAALRKGIKIIQQVAKALAPTRLKHLQRAQGTKTKRGKRGKTVSFAVQGARTKYKKVVRAGRRSKTGTRRIIPAKYDHLVIGGVRPHSVRKGSRLERIVKRKGGERLLRAIGQGVGKPHPGHKPNPYRARAYNAVKDTVARVVLLAYAESIKKMILKANAKIRAKG